MTRRDPVPTDVNIDDAFAPYFDEVMESRQRETDEFYQSITPDSVSGDAAHVVRQALAGMFWTKQYYRYDVNKWLLEHQAHPNVAPQRDMRNKDGFHMINEDVISMPDKWEYPWYAAWDLAFHTIVLASADADFAQGQLALMLRERYLHPNGQLPAYEWNFSDVNPPLRAWASMFVYETQKRQRGKGDVEFLKRTFGTLMANFTWWVNRKDRFGKNVFEGGFLGLDNIGVFDRSAQLPTGGYREQADGTAWMVMFAQSMLAIAIELAAYDPVYDDMASKFADHFLLIASSINRVGADEQGLWDEDDGFYYDVLRRPDGATVPLKVRSIMGLLPLCATTVVEKYQRDRMPNLLERVKRRIQEISALRSMREIEPGQYSVANRALLSLVGRDRSQRILAYMLDENEFLSPYGIRSLSRFHVDHPYIYYVNGTAHRVNYLPAESDGGMFGGNSNWRGPISFPLNALLVRSLLSFYLYYGDDFKAECPTGSGKMMNLYQVAEEISRRLASIFMRDDPGRRPVYGGMDKFQHDPHWRDHLLFHEYFHGDNGAGLGASHQTGWTGLVAPLIQLFGFTDAKTYLEAGKPAAKRRTVPAKSVAEVTT